MTRDDDSASSSRQSTASGSDRGRAWLIPIKGPSLWPLPLVPAARELTLGRSEQCDLMVPSEAERVSRVHARFKHDGWRWRIADLRSKWGTYVNGCRVAPGFSVPLSDGDLVRIPPFLFRLSSHVQPPDLQETFDDTHDNVALVMLRPSDEPPQKSGGETVQGAGAGANAGARVKIPRNAHDEPDLARRITTAVLALPGVSRVGLLRYFDHGERVQVMGEQPAAAPPQSPYSRTLVKTASEGLVALGMLSTGVATRSAHAAIAMPVNLHEDVDAVLYVRAPDGAPSLPADTIAACRRLSQWAGQQLERLRRNEMVEQVRVVDSEHARAGEAQRMLFPAERLETGPFVCRGECRPGGHLSGDLYDIVPLPNDRVAIFLGDVTSKGVVASVLMAAVQGYLRAALESDADPDPMRVVRALNAYVCPRVPGGTFVTLWVGVLDAQNSTLSFVDAGHSYAVLLRPDGSHVPLSASSGGGGMPVGISANETYDRDTMPLMPGARVIAFSDGFVEQIGHPYSSPTDGPSDTTCAPEPQHFTFQRACQVLADTRDSDDEIAALFAAVESHAGMRQLEDDATVVSVRFTTG
jgi:serine phosphatase RsbU (regulator of sigma subunit)